MHLRTYLRTCMGTRLKMCITMDSVVIDLVLSNQICHMFQNVR